MLNLCVCDDEEITLEMLVNKISYCMDKADVQYNIESYTNIDEIIENSSKFDAFFLDIDFNDSDYTEKGIDIAEQIHFKNPNTIIIFITNYENLVFKSLKVRPLAFIRKTYLDQEINDTIILLFNEIERLNRSFVFHFKNKIINLKLNDIMYIEGCRHDIFLHLSNGYVQKINSTLDTIEKDLSGFGFVRLHIGYITSCEKIFSIEKNSVVLKDNTVLPMSRMRASGIKKKFAMYSERS